MAGDLTTRNVMARGQSGPVSHTALLMNAIEAIVLAI